MFIIYSKSIYQSNINTAKENTIWDHPANLIEFNQISLWKVIEKEKIEQILKRIYSENDKLKQIKHRIQNRDINYNEINCCLAYIKSKNREKNVLYHIKWYKQVHCMRKCYFDKRQRKECLKKFDIFQSHNPDIKIKRQDFIDLFNNHLKICILPEKEKKTYLSFIQFQNIRRKINVIKSSKARYFSF